MNKYTVFAFLLFLLLANFLSGIYAWVCLAIAGSLAVINFIRVLNDGDDPIKGRKEDEG